MASSTSSLDEATAALATARQKYEKLQTTVHATQQEFSSVRERLKQEEADLETARLEHQRTFRTLHEAVQAYGGGLGVVGTGDAINNHGAQEGQVATSVKSSFPAPGLVSQLQSKLSLAWFSLDSTR